MKAASYRNILLFLGLLNLGIVLALLWMQVDAQQELRSYRKGRFVREVKQRSVTFDYFYSERVNDLNDLAALPSIEAYYINKSLGMSLKYGLLANLEDIAHLFTRLMKERNIIMKALSIRSWLPTLIITLHWANPL